MTARLAIVGLIGLVCLGSVAQAAPVIRSAACVSARSPKMVPNDAHGPTGSSTTDATKENADRGAPTRSYGEDTCQLGSRLRIEVDGLQPSAGAVVDPGALQLVIDERIIAGLTPIAWSAPDSAGEPTTLWFILKRDRSNGAATLVWNSILSRSLLGDLPPYEPKSVTVAADDPNAPLEPGDDAVGLEIGLALNRDGQVIRAPRPIPFDGRPRTELVTAGLVFLALLVSFVWLARSSDILRNTGPSPAAGQRRPYSLARTQMAWWFFVILGAFVFIWIVTGDDTTLSEQALALMGISSLTGLAAAAVDASDSGSGNGNVGTSTAGAATTAVPVSTHFINDVLTEGDGVSFHRLQMLTWTVVAGIVFLGTVVASLAMPDLNPTLLLLMGISSGTYLGFKLPMTK